MSVDNCCIWGQAYRQMKHVYWQVGNVKRQVKFTDKLKVLKPKSDEIIFILA